MTLQGNSFQSAIALAWRDQAPEDQVWFLVQVRPNQGDRARVNLERQGYPCFAPIRPVTRRRGVRLISGHEPLFPGYLFLQIAPDQAWRPVNSTYGVAGLVMRRRHQPQPVPAPIMADLFERTGPDGILLPPVALAPGDQVRIAVGPMTSFVATVERLESAERVRLLVEMMGQIVRVAIPVASLAPHAE